jgi:hypothetical protein
MSSGSYDETRLMAAAQRQKIRMPDRAVVAAAERQMQRWLLESRGKAKKVAPSADRMSNTGPYVAISREAGAGGSKIAELVGGALGWDVLDRKILEYMAERYHVSPAMLELVDETTSHWITDIFGNLIDPDSISQVQYVFRLSRMILMAARTGKFVCVGRGAGFLLPPERGVRVRLIAGQKYRVRQIMERRDLTFESAREYVTKTDRDRQAFVERYFHHDVSDPHLFDLVINVEKLGPHLAARQISDAAVSCLHVKRAS